jgi:hypothetical protein
VFPGLQISGGDDADRFRHACRAELRSAHVSLEERRNLRRRGTPHRLAIDRTAGRLANAIERKHDGFDRLLPSDESQRR